jgi:Tfp pilus assembly protein PilV
MRNQSGFTLIQTLIAIGLGTIVSLGLAATLVAAQKDHYRKSAQVAIYTIVNNIRFNGASYMAMNRSALENRKSGENPFLAACTCGEPNCTANTPYGLDLYDVSGTKIAGNSIPRYYDHSGDECDPVLRISYVLKPTDPLRSAPAYGELPTINSPDIDITANSIRTYALQNNLCVLVTGISPGSGSYLGGTSVAIRGSGLSQISSILIGPSACSITSQSNPEIVCTTAAGPQGAQKVTLYYGATETIEIANGFTYDTTPPQKICKWHPLTQGTSTSLPPCSELNQGQKYQSGSSSEYACRCE